jgi:hypothetical protein
MHVKLSNSLQLFFTCELPVTLSYSELNSSQSQSQSQIATDGVSQ